MILKTTDLDRENENHRSTGQDADQDAKDELTKEWAALTTWIRMNLHQPRTNKRKVSFFSFPYGQFV